MNPVLELEANVTSRGQTTLPAAIRKMLALGEGAQIIFRAMPDGTVIIARKPETMADPVVDRFLAFLASDIARHPQSLVPVSSAFIAQAQSLVEGVEFDLDAPLPDEAA